MILEALFVFLLVVIIVMQDRRIKKLEVGQEMVEEAIDQLFEIVYPDDECDMCGDILPEMSFEEWLDSLPKEEVAPKKEVKKTKKEDKNFFEPKKPVKKGLTKK